MRERVEHLGGHFKVHSAAGRGTQLCVELPVQPTDANRHTVSVNE
jgi:signal transduction histidine kinase